MKQFLFPALTILYLAITLPSCKKSKDEAMPIQTVEVTLTGDQSYQYDLGFFGDEEGATISRQASHYEVSATNREVHSGKVNYTYKPAADFSGTDEVQLKSERGSDGASPNHKVQYTVIKFNVIR